MGVKIKQHDPMDCGAAALASVCIHYKLQIPIARVRQYANTDRRGTNMLGLIEASKKLGFAAKGVKASIANLSEVQMPAIAHILAQGKFPHYVVIYHVGSKYIKIMDPESGEFKKLTHSEFEEEWKGLLVILSPDDTFKAGVVGVSNRVKLFSLLKPNTGSLIQIIIGALLYTLLGITTSIYIGKITDFVIPNDNRNLMNLMSTAMLMIIIIQLIVGLFRNILSMKVGQILDARLILGYYKQLLKLQQSFFDSMRVGEILSRINDAVKIRSFINEVAVNFFINICIVVFSFLLMYTYNWKMALMISTCIPFYGGLFFISNKLNKKSVRTVMEKSADLESQLVESINAMETIKQFGLEEYSNLKTEEKFISLLNNLYKVNTNNISFFFAGDAFARILTVVLFWAGTYYISKNVLTPGELFSFYALIGFFTGPIESLVNSNRQIQEASIAADRLFEIMDLEQDEKQINKIELTPELMGDIRFENVGFRYGSRAKIFEDISFVIPQNKITAIIGVSGSGKSTILGLLQKLYPVGSGKIFVGDCDLQNLSNQSLRSAISVVPQSIVLFAGDIFENITIGDPKPDVHKVIKVCRQLRISDFIESLPNGYHTYIGENGTTLSEGQRQRIGIARALYRNFDILLMDEATSSLDGFSDSYVQDIIQDLKEENKTIVIITHKLSSITHADQIIVLKDGKIVEQGTHETLVNSQSYYYSLWKNQI
ncbi:peptidase domain-containing ABC transporter [Hymenobacter metallicola]|uniref:Peptidase domain-containing ABC transporter n=1 Tax=Hymenobacter metallicola TaxID=2563114 RepID=A0A4Z0QEH3_9BACT|nr:peptidase domain-containing ABC transporter [Hymenobacter metallicola]TGE28114.1 peptidase domain-containing ABC transporter [Hymenobacter metallicola]